jgi:hypothetical protein
MKLYSVTGRIINKNVSQFLIDWDKQSRSKIQFQVKQFLKPFWQTHVCYEEFPVFGSRMKVDFINVSRKIAVEVNGDQHSSFNKFFHNNSRLNYLNSIKRDYKKSVWLEKNGFQLIELETSDLNKLSYDYINHTFNISLV